MEAIAFSDDQKNWLLNPDLAQGESHWEGLASGDAVVDLTSTEGRPAVRLVRPPGPWEPIVWSQRVTDLPTRRQATLTARVRVEEGLAQLLVRCYGSDGSTIGGHHAVAAPWIPSGQDWQAAAFTFVVPAETAAVEIGGTLLTPGRAWFTEFALRLVPEEEAHLRRALVEKLVGVGVIPTAACRRAFLRVPRHCFLPDLTLGEVYVDAAISTRFQGEHGRSTVMVSSSQPGIMAMNVGQLRLRRGLRVFEIGAGTGYNAAILAEIVGAENVVSIDLDEEIVAEARSHLSAAGYPGVFVDTADGWDGYPASAPYDRILGTVGVHDLAPAWVEQLREGGLLVLWLSVRCAQFMVAFRKRGDCLVSEGPISLVWGVDLRGKQPRRLTHRYTDHLTVMHDALSEEDLAALDEILNRPAGRISDVEMPDVTTPRGGFAGFVALSHPFALLIGDPRLSSHGIEGLTGAIADLKRRQLVIPGFNLCFGGTEIGEELRRLAGEWQAMGRPGLDRLTLAAYPRATYPSVESLPPGRWRGVIEKEHTWFRWRYRKSKG